MFFTVTIDNNNYKFDKEKKIIEILKNKYKSKLNTIVAAYINNKLFDLNTIIKKDSKIKLIYESDNIYKNNILYRSSLFILGFVIKKIFPESLLLNSKIKNNFFYYDFYIKNVLTEDILFNIEKEINNIINHKININKVFLKKENIIKILEKNKYNFKLKFLLKNKNLINKYNIYNIYNYFDICLGINVINTKFIKKIFIFKKIYQTWYGKNNLNKIVYRIYGNLEKNYFKKNIIKDHRLINNKIKLYYNFKETSNDIFLNNNGVIIFNELKNFIRKKLINLKYKEVKTPIIMKENLWSKTEHLKFYHKNMYNLFIDNNKYCIKPMNCPSHIKIFKNKTRSYKDLPYKILEFGNCHRFEFSGSLHGLMRTRSFTQDDTHIFCDKKNIKKEILKSINIIYEIYSIFNFRNILINLSTRPLKKIGNENTWNYSENIIKNILIKNNIKFNLNLGEGAFYGPKIEFIFVDSYNKHWQCGTIQLDFFLSKKLNSSYIDKYNNKKFPIIIHRAIFGSIERFIGIITEHYNGIFPLWLAPVQIVILSITNKESKYVLNISKRFINKNLRIKIDIKNETLNYKIRYYSNYKIPYIIICGKNEVKNKKISIKTINGENLKLISIDFFIKNILYEIKYKKDNNLFNEVYY